MMQDNLSITPGLEAPMLSLEETSDGNNRMESKNELSTLKGVYIPCMLSILGAILFLRLSWAVGQAGFLGVLAIFAISGTAVLLTALSISAISTNGTMGGGGAYYMISRSLGPEFGGAVGVIFYFANAFGTTFYLVAFADNVIDTFFSDAGEWYKIIIASLALAMTFCAAWIGAGFFSRLNVFILAFIVLSICTTTMSLLFGSEFGCTAQEGGLVGFTGINSQTLSDNWMPNYGPIIDDTTNLPTGNGDNTFFRVFGIVFPAMTGIMAGANLSGDLRDPGRSIGKGTIYAIFSSIAIYMTLAFLVSWTIESQTLKDRRQAVQDIACWSGGEYFVVVGIVSSTLSSALGALTGAARVLQAFAKDFSNIGESKSKMGASIVKILKFFSYGTPGKNEPRNAVIMTWAIAQALLFLGSLDLLAAIITNCFLLTYFFTNFACFVLKITGAPNFRPRFKYFSWHTALLGALLNIVIMFLASPIFAAVSIVLMSIVFGLIVYSAPEVPWGDVSQALIYHQVRKYLLRLDERKNHPKFWRPSILLIVDDPANSIGLIDFCNNLKKGGLYVIGDIVQGELNSAGGAVRELSDKWNQFIPLIQVKAFNEVVLADTYRSGCATLMICAGLGGMRPNTIVLPFMEAKQGLESPLIAPQRHNVSGDAIAVLEDIAKIHDGMGDDVRARKARTGSGVHINAVPTAEERADDYVGIIRDALILNKNLLVARDFDQLNKSLIVSQVKYGEEVGDGEARQRTVRKSNREVFYIDIWFTDELDASDLLSYSGNLSLMIQLAHGLNRTDIWQSCTKLRLVHLMNQSRGDTISDDMMKVYRSRLEGLLEESRVIADLEVLIMELDGNSSVESLTNAFIKKNTPKTAVIFMNLPFPPTVGGEETDALYMERLSTLTDALPPTVLSLAGQNQTVITTAI